MNIGVMSIHCPIFTPPLGKFCALTREIFLLLMEANHGAQIVGIYLVNNRNISMRLP